MSAFHNVIIILISVVKEDRNNHKNILLEKGSYKDKSNPGYF